MLTPLIWKQNGCGVLANMEKSTYSQTIDGMEEMVEYGLHNKLIKLPPQ